jgi:uncharacterized phiE125 gp8 family phage protein
MSLTLLEAPLMRPVSLEEAKAHLNVLHSDDDTLIGLYLDAAISNVDGAEGWLSRALVEQSWEYRIDCFPGYHSGWAIDVPLPPMRTLDEIKYLDSQGSEMTLDPSDVEVIPGGMRKWKITPAFGLSWPATRPGRDAVRIRFTAGYVAPVTDGSPWELASEIPAPIKAGILLMVGDMYRNREARTISAGAVLENPAVEALLTPYQLFSV